MLASTVVGELQICIATLIVEQTICAAIKACIYNGTAYYWRVRLEKLMKFVPPVELIKRALGFAATAVSNGIMFVYIQDYQTLVTLTNHLGSELNVKAIVVMLTLPL